MQPEYELTDIGIKFIFSVDMSMSMIENMAHISHSAQTSSAQKGKFKCSASASRQGCFLVHAQPCARRCAAVLPTDQYILKTLIKQFFAYRYVNIISVEIIESIFLLLIVFLMFILLFFLVKYRSLPCALVYYVVTVVWSVSWTIFLMCRSSLFYYTLRN